MACCGEEEDSKKEGIVVERKCRDVLCLLIFIAFWAGMFIIAAFASKEGEPNRLIYGIDSYGFTCGSKTEFKNTTLDLSSSKNQYYLNPLDLMSIVNIPYAKSTCVDGCPGDESVCDYSSLPCTNNTQYKCPYYRFAESDLYGKLSGVSDYDEAYYEKLATMSASPTDEAATKLIKALEYLNQPWINSFMATYNVSSSTSLSGRYYQLRSQFPGKGPCYPVWVPTTPYFNRCFPKFSANFTNGMVKAVAGAVSGVTSDAKAAFSDNFGSASNRFARYIGDISKGVLIIVVGGLVAGVIISLLWLIILRFAAGFMAWFTIIIINLLLIAVTLYCFSLAGMLGDNALSQGIMDNLPPDLDPTALDRKAWMWVGIVSGIVAGIVLLVTLLMIRRIWIAVACIKVASQAVGAMPTILLFPILPFIFEVGLLIYWIAITSLMYTAGDLTTHCRSSESYSPFSFSDYSSLSESAPASNVTNATATNCYSNETRDDMASYCAADPNCYLSYDWNNNLKYAFIYHFFGLLWTNQVIVGFSCVTIAGAIGSFYWAGGQSSKMPVFPVLVALKNTVVYHMGSIAFGAFIIAVIQFIRFLLDYLDRKTKDLQAANKCAEWAMCCCKCCICCLEKIVMYINRNAYIIVAVKGSNYCVSAGCAIALIIKNCLRLAVVNVIGDLLICLGKLAVAAACALIAFAMTSLPYYTDPAKYPDTYLSSPVLPVAICFLTGFIIAEIFFAVYEMAIDTVILAFCEDCDTNGGTPKYAPPLLMEAMGENPRPDEQSGDGGNDTGGAGKGNRVAPT